MASKLTAEQKRRERWLVTADAYVALLQPLLDTFLPGAHVHKRADTEKIVIEMDVSTAAGQVELLEAARNR